MSQSAPDIFDGALLINPNCTESYVVIEGGVITREPGVTQVYCLHSGKVIRFSPGDLAPLVNAGVVNARGMENLREVVWRELTRIDLLKRMVEIATERTPPAEITTDELLAQWLLSQDPVEFRGMLGKLQLALTGSELDAWLRFASFVLAHLLDSDDTRRLRELAQTKLEQRAAVSALPATFRLKSCPCSGIIAGRFTRSLSNRGPVQLEEGASWQ